LRGAGVVQASIDVGVKTNEITRFAPLLDQIGDLRNTIITVDALHCQREHATYLAERGADWILTVQANQPTLHQQPAALPWRAVPDAARDTGREHGRREIRTLKIRQLPRSGRVGGDDKERAGATRSRTL
jgi:predicted transposase YbfD/YdcC